MAVILPGIALSKGNDPSQTLDGGSALAVSVAVDDFMRASAEGGGLLTKFDKYTVHVVRSDASYQVVIDPPSGARGGVGIYEVAAGTWQVTKRTFLK